MYHVIVRLAKMLAPITPFISEYVYDQLKVQDKNEAANSARQEAKIKLRWPVKEVVVTGDAALEKAVEQLNAILVKSCNAQKVAFWKTDEGTKGFVSRDAAGGKVYVNPARDEALVNESLFRELARAVQDGRKKNGFNVGERIALTVFSADAKFSAFLAKKVGDLAVEVGAKSAIPAAGEAGLKGDFAVEVSFEGLPGVKAKFSRA